MGNHLKLGVIGSGSIVNYHLDALKSAGFKMEAIGSRRDSKTTMALGKDYKFAKICQDWKEVLDQDIEALLISAKSEVNSSILKVSLNRDVPILIEKPVTTHLQSFDELLGIQKNQIVQVGYNRRFYSSVTKLKTEIKDLKNYYFDVIISEESWNLNPSIKKIIDVILTNSVHLIDLSLFLFGNIKIRDIEVEKNSKNLISISVYCLTQAGSHGRILLTFGVPLNNSIQIYTTGKRFELLPIEIYREYDMIKMIPSSKVNPIKTYIPTSSKEEWKISHFDKSFKPGFFQQSKAFFENASTSKQPSEIGIPNLNSAKKIVEFCHEIISRL